LPLKREPTERQIEVNEVYHSLNCNVKATARYFDKTRNSISKTLLGGAINGLVVSPDKSSPVAPPGWSTRKKTVQYNKKGIVQVWDKLVPDEIDLKGLWRFLEERTPAAKIKLDPPKTFDKNLCLEWKLMDHHLGMHSWAKETGSNYGIKEARFLIESAAQKIFSLSGPVQKAIIVLGGDNIHADNRSAVTEKAKHHLDVDNRYEKSIDGIYCSMTTTIDISLTQANELEIIILSGNHDYHSAINLSRILKAHYRNEPRVKVNVSPGKHKFSRWGDNFFMYTHGDTAPAARLATFLLNHIIDKGIQGVKKKFIRKGHVHKRGKVYPAGLTEEDGVIIETFPTLAAPDSWTAENAYSQSRATVAEIYHKKYGQRSRMELGVAELMENFN